MSHIVTIRSRLTDPAALATACRRLGLEAPAAGTATLFAEPAARQHVRHPGWRYTAVVDTASGEVKFDNYNGAWGAQAELDKLLQAYAVEKARIEARRAGHTVSEQALADGSIKLTIRVSGGAA
jgi:hypothetical protein